jgi:hypothetical protein
MKTYTALRLGMVLAAMLWILDSPFAATAQNEDQGQDPPIRVARLNYAIGSVSMQPGGEGGWVEAVTNRPIIAGDNLWADKDARAELHVGSTAIRIDSETSVTFLDLDNHTTQLKLSQGSLILRVRHLDDGDLFEVDTPNLAFTVQQTGEYRIDVNGDGNETDASVWHGRGEATGGGASYIVVAGQRARFNGNDQLDHEIDQLPGTDDFDSWAFNRDQHEDRVESANYISTEMTGYEDLDDYGRWHYVAEYGPVWTPVGVAAGWAPYRFGHWVWVAPWGWTWVEEEPWGFAPFHYGRWALVESSWCWVPGPIVVRPVYAPALVAFVGGGGFNLAIGVGEGVAWFPLAPREVYVPWYHTSRVYVNNVNITNTRVNVTQVTNVYNVYNTSNVQGAARVSYVNQRVTSAVTAVSHDTFVNARPVARNLARVDARQIAEAPVTAHPQLQPVRASLLGAGAPARVRPPAAVVSREVVATRTPSAPRVPFEQRQANVRTEAPVTPQPAARVPSPAPQPQGNPRFEQQQSVARPQAPATAERPEQPRYVPRPQNAQPQPEIRQEAPRVEQRSMPHPAQPQAYQAPPRPLVRTAPPVESRPEIQRSEEQKFGNWQQQRQQQQQQQRSMPAPQPQARAPQPPPQAARPAEPAHAGQPSQSERPHR